MPESINRENFPRRVTLVVPGDVIEDVDGVPAYVTEPREFTGTLSRHWDEIIRDGGRNEH